MLTLYYASTTFLQSWRITKVCSKISEQLAQHATISFYLLNAEKRDGFDIRLATSELCNNRSVAKVSEILWLKENQRGCCVRPRQSVQITPWITFPETPSWLPFAYTSNSAILLEQLKKSKGNLIHVLVETDIEPCWEKTTSNENVKIEEYGKLIAWKIDSNLTFLIETDLENFTKLLIATFLQNNCLINDQLPVIRIETVRYEGIPQPFDLVSNHLKKSICITSKPSVENWQKHLENLRTLSVLANQATEFEYNKNRTEGKTGVIKPDLIAHEPKSNDVKTELELFESEKRSIESAQTSKNVASHVDSTPPAPTTASPVKTPKDLQGPGENPTESKDVEDLADATTVYESPKKSKPKDKKSSSEMISSQNNESEEKAKKILEKLQSDSVMNEAVTQSGGDVSVMKDNAKRPNLKRYKDSLNESKPLNIFIYSESATVRDSTIVTLRDILEENVYTIYPISSQQVVEKHWFNNTALLVVCGTVPPNLGEIFVNYFLNGGKLVSICSDILHFLLPNYRTAEVREHELAQFSYGKWQKVKMMHHIFCYQPSPVKKNFSTDSEDSSQANSRKPALVCPRSIELKDLHGNSHNLEVQVLSTEETWNTPSILLATNTKSGGRAIFSQVHLETNPTEFEDDEVKFNVLKQNDKIRLEIFADLVQKHLNISVRHKDSADGGEIKQCIYQCAYFLGYHESKFELLEKLKDKYGNGYIIPTTNLTLHFCGKEEKPPHANTNVLPILIHSCPEDFSTVQYFDNLKTKSIGRLVMYAPIVSTSMNVINELELVHGLVVLARQQTEGMGRNNNQWLSPLGCAMFSLQLHVDLNSKLGSRLPILQHIIGAAMINALKTHEQYKILDIALKWPNDIYTGGSKIGGILVKTLVETNKAIVNVGCAINLNNSKPTTCLNDIIRNYNNRTGKQLPLLEYEQFIALIFNEIEKRIDEIEIKDFDDFYKLYYSLWLHSDQEIKIKDKDGNHKSATVIGIDEFGFLKVKLHDGIVEVVQPDGNSFDMLQGLIVPKFN